MKNNTVWLQRLVHLWRLAACLVLLLTPSCTPTVGQTPDPASLVVAVPRGVLSAALEAAVTAYAQGGGGPVQVAAFSSEAYGSQVHAALLAGLERYDLVYLPAEALARWAGYSAIQPLTANFDDPALQPWLAAVTVTGQVYGLPTQPDPAVVWYRSDLLQAAGLDVPTTWEELRQAAHLLSAPPERYGIVTARVDMEAGLDFAAVLAGSGGEMVNAQYQVQVDGEPALRAMETYAALTAPGAEDFTRADVLAALQENRAAFGIAPYAAGGALQDCSASPKACREEGPLLKWARLPGLVEQQAVGDLGAWAIPLHAARSAQAQRFVEWLGSQAGARVWSQASGTPAHVQVLAELAREHPLRQVTTYRLAFPPVTTNDLLWKAINTAITEVVSGEQPPKNALNTAANQMRQALRRAGYSLEE